MKWIKKYKDEIINGVQFFTMLYTMTMGFWFTYLWAWFKFGLPIEWWAVATTMALALLSVFGFCQWVTGS